MGIGGLVEFLNGRAGIGSEIDYSGDAKMKRLIIKTRQKLEEETLVYLVKMFCEKKGYEVKGDAVELNVSDGCIVTITSDKSPRSELPPFFTFVIINETAHSSEEQRL